METKKIDRSIIESLKHIKKESLPNQFLKLYSKRRGKYKGWSDLSSETLIPEEKSDLRNEMEVG